MSVILFTSITIMDEEGSVNSQWFWFGRHIPKLEIVFFSQIFVLYIVIISAVINLSIKNGDPTLWSTLLGSCLGYCLPAPSIKSHKLVKPPNTP